MNNWAEIHMTGGAPGADHRRMTGDQVDLETFSRLVASVYEAVVDPTTWHSALIDIASVFEGACCSLVHGDQAITHGAGLEAATVRQYNEYYRELDPIARIATRSRMGAVRRVFDEIVEGHQDTSEFFVDWARPSGLGDGLFARYADRDGVPGWICIAAEPHRRFESPDRIMVLSHLIPHLRVAAAIGATLEEQRRKLRLSVEILDRLEHGALLIDQRRRIQYMNAAAYTIVHRRDGLSVGGHGELSAAAPSDRSAVRTLVTRACGHDGRLASGGSISVSRPASGYRYVLHALPIRCDGQAGPAPLALVTIVDPAAAGRSPVGVWRDVYGLTPREADIAEHVIRGDGLRAVAEELAVTLSTVRTHLQHVFDKTGTHRQAELARLLRTTGPVFGQRRGT